MSSLCLGLAGVVWLSLPWPDFTLAWAHSVEKIRWEEDYRVTSSGLLLMKARVRGAGAGMEIPDDAERQEGGVWQYQRALPPLHVLRLGRTPEAGDYDLCFEQQCHLLSEWLGPPQAAWPEVELWACARDH